MSYKIRLSRTRVSGHGRRYSARGLQVFLHFMVSAGSIALALSAQLARKRKDHLVAEL